MRRIATLAFSLLMLSQFTQADGKHYQEDVFVSCYATLKTLSNGDYEVHTSPKDCGSFNLITQRFINNTSLIKCPEGYQPNGFLEGYVTGKADNETFFSSKQTCEKLEHSITASNFKDKKVECRFTAMNVGVDKRDWRVIGSLPRNCGTVYPDGSYKGNGEFICPEGYTKIHEDAGGVVSEYSNERFYHGESICRTWIN